MIKDIIFDSINKANMKKTIIITALGIAIVSLIIIAVGFTCSDCLTYTR